MRCFVTTIFLLVLSVTACAREGETGRAVAKVGDTAIEVFTYRPASCPRPTILFVFAGYHRDADRYRDRAVPAAKRHCLVVLAPHLDRERFPNWRYHRVGVSKGGEVQEKRRWTTSLLKELIAWGRTWAGDPDRPYILFGHSAGGQLLSRFAAYAPPEGAQRIVIANPSVHVRASLEEDAPYGFDQIFSEAERLERLREYLALPVTIFLGARDRGAKRLVENEPARRQGDTRHARGLNVFEEASKLAKDRGWAFNWRLVEVPGVGHSSSGMLSSERVELAFGLAEPVPAGAH